MTATESEDGVRLDREITTFTRQPNETYRRTEEHHVLRLYDRVEVMSMVSRIGFEAEVLTDFRSTDVRRDLPGWYVIEAHKPK